MELSTFYNRDGGLLAKRSLALASMILLLCFFQLWMMLYNCLVFQKKLWIDAKCREMCILKL